MTYAAGQLIQASDYNGFVSTNTNNVNSWWGTGSGSAGWGQTALSTVSAGDTITALSWASLINTIKAGANHTGTAVTNRTAPSVGNTVTIFPNVDTDIGSINTNRGNAVASGSTNGTWTGSASVTSATGSGNENWTMTWTNTVTFGSANQARYFFNAGGLVRIQMGKSSTGTTKDTFWNSLVSSVGTIFISGGIGASQSISGTEYTGVTVSGSSGAYTSNSSAGWYYLLANGSTQIYQKTQTSSPYTSDTITVTAVASGATLTITAVWNSPGLSGQTNNSVSGGTATASPFSSFGSAPAVVVNTVYPSTTYLSDSWSTNSIAESVAVNTSPGPAPAAAEFLLIGGGGGGGGQGGGGGGGMVYRSSLTLPTSGQGFTVVIGAGGLASVGTERTANYGGYPGTITVYQAAPTAGSAGSTTSINANGTIVQAYGGGAGGSVNTNSAALIGSAGGPPIFNGSTSLSGAVGTGGTTYYASSSTGTSYRGGANEGAGAGGGGAGSAGSASLTPNVQVGGNGYEFWTGYGFAAGGGAGGYRSLGGNPFPSSGTYGGSTSTNWYGGRAGVLAGNTGGVFNSSYENAQSALSNTGSGGGGAAYGQVLPTEGAGTQGGNGGSGAIVIRYPGASSILSYSGQWTTNITGGYVYHYIKSSGSLYPAGEAPPDPTPANLSIDYQLIAGGGTGGIRGGGGGGGGVAQASGTLIAGSSYIVSIGAGASGLTSSSAAAAGYSGQNSNFTGSGISAVAGGGGYGGAEGVYSSAGGPGGSGGGGAMTSGAGGIADAFSYGNLAYPGGIGENQAIGAYTFGEAGGGGASSAGVNGSYGGIGGQGGAGGAGIMCYDNVFRAGGGGGSGRAAPGWGGNRSSAGYGYGATAGALPNQNTLSALANSGGGSGGAYADGSSVSTGNGGSGVLVIRYPGSVSRISYTGTYTTQTIGGYVVHTITSSGTLTVVPGAGFGYNTVGDGTGTGAGSGLVYGAHTTSGGNAGMPGLTWVQNYDTSANLWQVNCASNNWFPLIITLNNIYRLGSSDMGYTLSNVPIFMWRHPNSQWSSSMITNELGMNADQISRSFIGTQVWWEATYAGMDDQLYWGFAILDSRNYSAGTPGNTWTNKTLIPYWYASDFGGEWQGHGFITYPSISGNVATVPQTFTRTGATSRDGGGYAPPTRSDYAVTLDQYSLVIPVLASNNGFSGGAYNGARNPLTAKFGYIGFPPSS